MLNFFIPKSDFTYVPMTLVTYRIDKWLHFWWADKYFHSWAPGIRLDTALIHAGAALFVWRLLVRLRFSETRSFFIALLFACHPLVCETVCWVSERKNALAALFGFAALWTQSLAFGVPSPTSESSPQSARTIGAWRQPIVCILFALALLGKPSALGLLPIMLLLECAVLFPAIRFRLLGKETWNSNLVAGVRWISYLGMAVLIAIALACVKINLFSHSGDIIPPPGGSIFTALLTDLDIFSRYMFNLILPVNLSSMYLVEAICSLTDSRVWLYGGLITSVIGGTLYFGRNRWIVLLGWFWFFSALATNANVISIEHWMQDRYLYLATPGFFIAISEFTIGIVQRSCGEQQGRKLTNILGAALCCGFMAISTLRGFVWSSTLLMSLDATQKQPKSFFAHYTLSCALYPPATHTAPGSPEYEIFQREWRRQLLIALNECPDADRFNYKQGAAADLGKDAFSRGDVATAEKYFNIAVIKSRSTPDFVEAHSISLSYLSLLDLYYKRNPETALSKAREAMRLYPSDQSRFAMGSACLACAQQSPQARSKLLKAARVCLNTISKNTAIREDADALIQRIDKLIAENPAELKQTDRTK